MQQVRASERRSGYDRRTTGTVPYAGPERRILRHRRTSDLIVCLYCKQNSGPRGDWSENITLLEDVDGCRAGICPDCSSKRFPQFYSKNWVAQVTVLLIYFELRFIIVFNTQIRVLVSNTHSFTIKPHFSIWVTPGTESFHILLLSILFIHQKEG